MTNTGSSLSGYHFITKFLTCQRLFYFEEIEKLGPLQESHFLLRGRALHSAHEAYFKGNTDKLAMIEVYTDDLGDEDYADKIQWVNDRDWGEKLLNLWYDTWHEENQKRYEVLEVETEHEATLPNGKLFTARIDRILHDNFLVCNIIQDTKTTSFSVGRKFQQCDDEDQASSNMWVLSKTRPDLNVRTFMPDILYNRSNSYDCARPGVIYRSERDLEDVAVSLARTTDDIDKAVASLDYNRPLAFSFRRAPESCGNYSGCPFRSICRTYEPGSVPVGFKRKET